MKTQKFVITIEYGKKDACGNPIPPKTEGELRKIIQNGISAESITVDEITRSDHEYWEGHEKVREYDKNGRWRLIEIIGEQYGDTDYWKDTPFRIRMNKGGEDWNEYKSLKDALTDWVQIDDLYNLYQSVLK